MKVKVANFGPIKQADIELKPLTILIGKNNLGKSYLSQLVHVLLTTFRRRFERPFRIGSYRGFQSRVVRIRNRTFVYPYYYPIRISEEDRKEISRKLRNENIKFEDIINDLIESSYKSMIPELERNIKFELERAYGMKISKLVNLNANQSNIEFEFNEYSIFKLTITSKDKLTLQITSDINKFTNLIKKSDIFKDLRKKKRIPESTINELLSYLTFFMFKQDFSDSIYIPAGRAGLIEGYDTVSSALFTLTSFGPIHGISMPPLPGMASDFYNKLLSLRGERGPLSTIADKMKNIFKGTIQLRRVEGVTSGASRIYYIFEMKEKSRKMEIIHAASMIKELSPLYLIIKEEITPTSLLVVEEPESHLHPGAQNILMEIFVEMVNKDVSLILTTHSDILIRKLGNIIARYKLKDIESELNSINPKLISIYCLNGDFEGSTSSIIPIPEDGLFDELPEFDHVIKELYDESISIQNKLQLEE